MESKKYVSGGKGSVANETISTTDSFTRSKSSLMGWELKNLCCFGGNMLVSGQQATENQGFGEFGHKDLIGKQLPNASIGDASSKPTPNALYRDDDSSSKLSCSAVDANSSRDSLLIDLKLGRFTDQRDGHNSKFSLGTPILCSSESYTPPKRVRLAEINSHSAYCQVYGCNKDLSSSKDYHKRHKVCEVHSKTAKVIVNGIEQRFCQQCSRFLFLAEFDDGKRSCRKHLAGHNEHRRKPHLAVHSGRTGKLLHSYNDSGCALSLLSSKSQDSSSRLSGIPVTCSLALTGHDTHYSMFQASEKLTGVSSQASTGGVSKKLLSSGVNSVEESNLSPILISESYTSDNFGINSGIYQGSDFMSGKDSFSSENEATIDLIQLSTQL